MANTLGGNFAVKGKITDVDSTQQNVLGTRAVDELGNEYIYLQGITSVAVNVAVVYKLPTYIAKILTADDSGNVAIAQGSVIASTFGWFQIYGFYTTCKSDTVAAAGALFIDGTPGRVDDASVAGDEIFGMVSTGADATNLLPVHLQYPYVGNTVQA